jgi:hypothetical protein
MRLKIILLIAIIVIALGGPPLDAAHAQATPLPAPNALLIYDKTTVALINTSSAPISLLGVSFMRNGGGFKFNAQTMMTRLAPGHCIQVWTTEVRQIIGKPPECAVRDRWQRLSNKGSYFWVADWDGEAFRPQLRNSALRICKAAFSAAERCELYIPQGDEANKPWTVLDPETGVPLPAGIQVAYDANQFWLANLMPDTVLSLKGLLLLYSVNGQAKLWAPAGQKTWDDGVEWIGQGLKPGECLLYYADPAQITPLLPCQPVLKSPHPDLFWRTKFEVMGPREERRSECGSGEAVTGPVLCVIGG